MCEEERCVALSAHLTIVRLINVYVQIVSCNGDEAVVPMFIVRVIEIIVGISWLRMHGIRLDDLFRIADGETNM